MFKVCHGCSVLSLQHLVAHIECTMRLARLWYKSLPFYWRDVMGLHNIVL